MNHLLRQVAPITESGWALLDEEAKERLGPNLAARKLVDFAGPYGWQHSAVNLGHTIPLGPGPGELVTAVRRMVMPLVELRSDFVVPRLQLEDYERGAVDTDLRALDEAAKRIAVAENAAVFHGMDEAGITGVAEASTHEPLPLSEEVDAYPRHVAQAVELLRGVGIGGPYGLALGPKMYTLVIETTEHGGYPLFDHLHHILDGPVVWAPGVRGGVVVSLRGGDFLFECGQDLAIGYHHHDEESVHLYFEESFALRVATPEAAVWLKA